MTSFLVRKCLGFAEFVESLTAEERRDIHSTTRGS